MNNDEKIISDENQFLAVYLTVKRIISFLYERWKIILFVSILGAVLGLFYSTRKETIYVGTLTFVTEEEKSNIPSLGSAAGLASSLGLDLGGGSGSAFNGNNLIELMKSRLLIEKALLQPIKIGNSRIISLADYLIEIEGMNKKDKDKEILIKNSFYPIKERTSYSYQQDSILAILYGKIVSTKNGIVSVFQKEKKVNIISVEVKSKSEIFSKVFAEVLVKEVSNFYIETKSLRTKQNVEILQKQVDSVRNKLNEAISGVASVSDNTFNLNNALMIKRAPSQKRQVDVQANTVILTQLVANLEMARVALRKETPLIQVIDHPILPLKRITTSKMKFLIVGGIVGCLITVVILLSFQYIKTQLQLVSLLEKRNRLR